MWNQIQVLTPHQLSFKRRDPVENTPNTPINLKCSDIFSNVNFILNWNEIRIVNLSARVKGFVDFGFDLKYSIDS